MRSRSPFEQVEMAIEEKRGRILRDPEACRIISAQFKLVLTPDGFLVQHIGIVIEVKVVEQLET